MYILTLDSTAWLIHVVFARCESIHLNTWWRDRRDKQELRKSCKHVHSRVIENLAKRTRRDSGSNLPFGVSLSRTFEDVFASIDTQDKRHENPSAAVPIFATASRWSVSSCDPAKLCAQFLLGDHMEHPALISPHFNSGQCKRHRWSWWTPFAPENILNKSLKRLM